MSLLSDAKLPDAVQRLLRHYLHSRRFTIPCRPGEHLLTDRTLSEHLNRFFFSVLLVLLTTAAAHAAPAVVTPHPAALPSNVTLSDGWRLEDVAKAPET